MVAHFPCEKEPLGKSPPIDISQGFNEKQIGVPSDRVYALQHLIMPGEFAVSRRIVHSHRMYEICYRKLGMVH